MAIAGYSGKPLSQKLGIKPGMSLLIVNASERLFEELPDSVQLKTTTSMPKSTSSLYDYIHLFLTQKTVLIDSLQQAKALLQQHGMIWVSWPKKAARKFGNIETDLTEDVIRDHALAIGLVDVKVCAIDEIFSGLKLVIPVKLRK